MNNIPDEVNKVESSTNSELGSYHNTETLLSRISHIGEYMKRHGNCAGYDIDWGNVLYDAVVELRASRSIASEEISRLKAENDRLRGALSEIVSPISYMQNRLKEGEQLNGIYAVKLADDANYLRGIAANAIDDQISQRDGMRMQINSLEDALMVKNSEVDALKAENERLRGEMWKSIDDALPTIKDSCDGKVECFHPRFGVRYVLWQSVKNWKDYAGYTHWRVLNLPPPPKSK